MIQHTSVDGVETLIAPTTGPAHAGITFRVGRADETLARSGITHLVEHLALHHLGMADYHFNGATGAVTTRFHLQGSDSDVASFITGVCDALSNLPMDRLDLEKGILRTEASSRSWSVTEPLSLWRYGARTHGLLSYPEWGLTMFGPDEVRAWAARYFTRENAVLWIAGDHVPDGLRLRLPAGNRHRVPAATSALPQTPAFFCGSTRTVAYEAIVTRRPAASIFASLLERELFRSLRQEAGLSYTAAAVYEPRGDGYASVVALADALPDKQDAVLGGFVDVLAKLRVGRIDQVDLDAVIAKNDDVFNRSDVDSARLPGAAFNQLVGYPNRTAEELRAEIHAITLADVHAVAQEGANSGLLMTPEGHGALWAGFESAPTQSPDVVSGSQFASHESKDAYVIVGPEGVSSVSRGNQATVRFAQCAALLSWPDGGRLLIGNDGISVRVEPTLYAIQPRQIQAIDAGVPHDCRVLLTPRDSGSIPQPRPATPEPGKVVARPGTLETVTMVVVGLAALVFVCLGGLFTVAIGTSDNADGGQWAVVASVWCIAAVLVLPAVLLVRRRQASRR